MRVEWWQQCFSGKMSSGIGGRGGGGVGNRRIGSAVIDGQGGGIS